MGVEPFISFKMVQMGVLYMIFKQFLWTRFEVIHVTMDDTHGPKNFLFLLNYTSLTFTLEFIFQVWPLLWNLFSKVHEHPQIHDFPVDTLANESDNVVSTLENSFTAYIPLKHKQFKVLC
jgi:hypothetical protein